MTRLRRDRDVAAFAVDVLVIQQLLRGKKLGQIKAGRADGDFLRRWEGDRGRARFAGVGNGPHRVDDDFVHRPPHRPGRSLRVVGGRVVEHANLVFLIDKVRPVEILERTAPTSVRRVHARRVAVTGRAALGRDGANLIEEALLADDGFVPHGRAQLRTLLLGKHHHVRRILLDERSGDLEGHCKCPVAEFWVSAGRVPSDGRPLPCA
jgi:hypothetical protein